MIRRIAQLLLNLIYALTLTGVLTLAGVYLALREDLPQLPAKLENINLNLPTELYSSDGERIHIVGQRRPVTLKDISPWFLKAIVSVEDRNFYNHRGLDHLGLLRALASNLKEGRVRQGGSGITQQLSKNLFFSFERNWVRKIKELFIALQLEATFSKDQILEAYSNQIYFGNGAYGVEEAARTYFDVPSKNLTLLQAALLAGLPNSPNNANPFSNLDRAMKRARHILARMVQTTMISETQKQNALTDDLKLTTPVKETDPNLYFVNYVMNQLEADYGREFVYFGGLKVYTTLDVRLQKAAEKAAQAHLDSLEKQLPERAPNAPLQIAVAAIENKGGAVRVLLGGRDFSNSQFNRAVSNNRLPGSSFKPFVYFTAMEKLGYSPATVVVDEPITYPIPGSDPWEPQNFANVYAGKLILKKALMHSINAVAARLINDVGPEEVIKTARQFGFKSPLGRNLSLALGTSPVSPLELAGAYSVIANLGIYNEPYLIRRIEDYDGNRLYEHFYEGVQRFPQKSIYPLLDMMQGVIDGGTGQVVRRMKFRHPAAGKTGTTNSFKDAWFNGFTKDITASVWVGYDDNEPMIGKNGKGLTGAGAAAPIWAFFMQKALEGKDQVQFPKPDGIRIESVDTKTGILHKPGSGEFLKVAVKNETIIPTQLDETSVEPETSSKEETPPNEVPSNIEKELGNETPSNSNTDEKMDDDELKKMSASELLKELTAAPETISPVRKPQ
ncbi:MAG: peptidase [Nitrospinae bacterium CG11_big_fil_rev_8_21_14_0_20_45_15]|nr:MAG: peptidase [Nitrospinae bacterium CG11_big_fil_rev_8_21_14_0_20_45_15]